MTLSRICDVCRTGNETVRRYGLAYYIPRPDLEPRNDGRLQQRQIAAGGIDMCSNCWDRIARPKTKNGQSKYQTKLHPSLAGSRLQVSRQTHMTLATTKNEGVRQA